MVLTFISPQLHHTWDSVPTWLSCFTDIVESLLERPIVIAAACLFAIARLTLRYKNSPWRHLPPGPRGLPILGSVFSFLDKTWLIRECPKYGEVVYLNVAGQPTILLNSQRVAADILDRRAATCSSRPRMVVTNELISDGLFISLQPHTDLWRRMRRAVHEAFKISAAPLYYDMHEAEARRLVLALASDAKAHGEISAHVFKERCHLFAGSVIMAITYDRPLDGKNLVEDGKILERANAFIRRSEDGVRPGAHFVEFIPWMLRIPTSLAKWKRDAFQAHAAASSLFTELADAVFKRMSAGNVKACLMTTLHDNRERFGLSDKESVWSAGIMYSVGADTQANTLEWWALAMLEFPETQKRAQAELDSVIGHARAPRVSDRAQLQYIAAMVHEVLRWRTGLPIGLPHLSEADEWYEGMFIPKGSILISNMYPCNHDPEIYGLDASTFNPSRHLDEAGRLMPAPPATKDEGHVSYGFGRRVCVGRHVADDALFAAIATILWAFNLEKVGDIDADGWEDQGFTFHPHAYKCALKPRFPEAINILHNELEAR